MAPNSKNDDDYQFARPRSTWKQNFAEIGGFLYFGSHFGFKMAAIANQRWISIRNIILYFETKFRPNRRIFVFWLPFWIQNGRHSKPTLSPYGATCLTSCKYPFPLKFFHFWIFNDFFHLYIGGHFEMAAIFKIPRLECTPWDGDPPSCEV